MAEATVDTYSPQLQQTIRELEVALPVAADTMDQDEEWIVVNTPDGWVKVRLHDYGDVYAIPGLYEKWVYQLFQCRSPQVVSELLVESVRKAGEDPAELTFLDLGAGNGYVAEVLHRLGCRHFVGVDIYPEAKMAAERDRPGLYRDFVVGDLTALTEEQDKQLSAHRFTALTCVAALGFGDIPPEVFAAAYNRVDDGGWVAFTIKSDFVSEEDRSGFSRLIEAMQKQDMLEMTARKSYVHRLATDGKELNYDAFIGRKRADIPDRLL